MANLYTEDFEAFNIADYSDNYGSWVISNEQNHSVAGTYSFKVPGNSIGGIRFTDFTSPTSDTWVWLTFWMFIVRGASTGGCIVHLSVMQYSAADWIQFDFRTSYGGFNEGQNGLCITHLNSGHGEVIEGLDSGQRAMDSFWNKWCKLQLGFQYSTGSIQAWIDDSKVFDHTGISLHDNAAQLSNFYHRIGEPNRASEAIYYDDARLDTGSRPESSPLRTLFRP